MTEVTRSNLRDQAGKVLDRVQRGEALAVTRDGLPIAELRPLPRRPVSAALLLKRWHWLPAAEPTRLRADLDRLLDSSL